MGNGESKEPVMGSRETENGKRETVGPRHENIPL
jgi:hypothetical protein